MLLLRSTLLLAALAPAAVAQLPMTPAGDLLVASSSNNRLLRLGFDGRQLAEYSYPGLLHARGIVVDTARGTVYLLSQFSGEVLVLDRELRLVRRFPTGAVRSPTGAGIGPNGNLFIAGFASNNAGEFRPDGTLVRTYSHSSLRASNCVAFGAGGNFYVASAANGQVVQFDGTGRYVRNFTGFGLSSPMGMAVYGGHLYVAGGGSSNIVVFTLDGRAVRQIRHSDISLPQGIAFRADGVFAVSGFSSNNVSWYRSDGTHLRTVRPTSSATPRSLAFLPGLTFSTPGQPVPGQPFAMRLSSPFEPGLGYLAALSFSQAPGLPLPDGRTFGLTYDPAFAVSIGFPGFLGSLSTSGEQSFSMTLPAVPWLRGVTIHAAALTIDPNLSTFVRQIAPARSWTL